MAYKQFLERFVDGADPDKKFSTIASLIHNWRNVLAHQWLGSIGHSIGYDYEMNEGWKVVGDITFINPKIYGEHYLNAFRADSPLWRPHKFLSDVEVNEVKQRLLTKYKSR